MSMLETMGRGMAALLGNDDFHARHLGPTGADEQAMLAALGIADRKSTRLNSSHVALSRMPSSA